MPANVESMASVREVPWHGIGTVLDDYTDVEGMLKAAELDWTVQFRYVFLGNEHIPDGDTSPSSDVVRLADGFYAIVRHAPQYPERDGSVFQMARSRYRLFQNQDIAEFGHDVLEVSGSAEGAKLETLGALNDGKTIFGTIRLPGDLLVAGSDPVHQYLVLASSHDGSLPFMAFLSNVRVVCQNTLNMAMRGVRNKVVVRHTTNLESRIEEAKRVLAFSSKYAEEFTATMNRLADVEFTLADMEALAAKLFPVKDADSDSANRNAQLALAGNFATSKTMPADRNTRWGALNAITEYAQWGRAYNKGSRSVDERRTESTWFGPNLTLGQKALDILTSDLDDSDVQPVKPKRQTVKQRTR